MNHATDDRRNLIVREGDVTYLRFTKNVFEKRVSAHFCHLKKGIGVDVEHCLTKSNILYQVLAKDQTNQVREERWLSVAIN